MQQNCLLRVKKQRNKEKIEAKAASRKWIQAGKPRNEDDQHFKAKKETNIKLRSAIKNVNNQAESEENNKIMNANIRDPKLFSQLVKKKKSNASGHTTMIKFDDNGFRGDSQVP